jgi:hypothetical protein
MRNLVVVPGYFPMDFAQSGGEPSVSMSFAIASKQPDRYPQSRFCDEGQAQEAMWLCAVLMLNQDQDHRLPDAR